MTHYADDFYSIPHALSHNDALRNRMKILIEYEPIPGKVTEGGNRLEDFRDILSNLTDGYIDLDQAYQHTTTKLPRYRSPYSNDNRVFPNGWAERLVRIQFSRFYNQAVLEELKEKGVQTCFVPHSSFEDTSSPCTSQLAGKRQSVQLLHERLISSYSHGIWSTKAKIPNHPHCTHVVKPVE